MADTRPESTDPTMRADVPAEYTGRGGEKTSAGDLRERVWGALVANLRIVESDSGSHMRLEGIARTTDAVLAVIDPDGLRAERDSYKAEAAERQLENIRLRTEVERLKYEVHYLREDWDPGQ